MAKTLHLDEIRKVNPKMAAAIERADKKAAPQAPCTYDEGTATGAAARPHSTKADEKPARDSRQSQPEHLVPAQPAARPSLIVIRFEQQLQAFPPPEREFFAIPGRNFRLDYAWPFYKVGVEIQGQQHRIKGRFKEDCEKRALHLIAGWRILELDRESIKTERSVEWLKALLRRR